LVLHLFACVVSSEFTVVMTAVSSQTDSSAVTVHLPENGREAEVFFSVNNVAYTAASRPTVSDPSFVFADEADDGIRSITLTLAEDSSGTAELRIVTDEGTEFLYNAPMKEFSRLTDYLRTN